MKINSPDSRIAWAEPLIGADERAALLRTFDSGWLSMGPRVQEFEHRMAEWLGVDHAISVSNGSVALDLALQSLNLKSGDEVIVPALCYFASAAAISRQGAVPVFTDVDPQSFNLDPEAVKLALSSRTRGILSIDYGGNPAPLSELNAIATEHSLFLLHDGAQSLGATIGQRSTIACTTLATMSFHMAKVMTTIEGGMIFCETRDQADLFRSLRSQGERGTSKYLHEDLGTNARMTDMQAAIGLEQLKKLDHIRSERARIPARYDELLADLPLTITTRTAPNNTHANFLYTILIEHRNEVAKALDEKHGIATRIAYPLPLYDQPVYKKGKALSRTMPCPHTEAICTRVLNLPLHTQLSDSDLLRVRDALARECAQ